MSKVKLVFESQMEASVVVPVFVSELLEDYEDVLDGSPNKNVTALWEILDNPPNEVAEWLYESPENLLTLTQAITTGRYTVQTDEDLLLERFELMADSERNGCVKALDTLGIYIKNINA